VAFYELGMADVAIGESYFAQPTIDNQTIRGTVIYIDSVGNAVVNITQDIFQREKRDRKFIIHMRKSVYNVTCISQSYEDVEVGEMVALFNQDGFLEIALNKESAAKLLGLKLMDPIRIEFNDSQVSQT
jgi:S-adenosylmethionine hydrolase